MNTDTKYVEDGLGNCVAIRVKRQEDGRTLASRIAAPFWWLTGKLFGHVRVQTAEQAEIARLHLEVEDLRRTLDAERARFRSRVQDVVGYVTASERDPFLAQQRQAQMLDSLLGKSMSWQQQQMYSAMNDPRRGLGGISGLLGGLGL